MGGRWVFVCSSNSLVVLVFADSRLSLSAFASFWRNEMVDFVSLMLHLVYDLLIAPSSFFCFLFLC